MEKIRTAKLKLTDLTKKASGFADAFGRIASPVWKALLYSPLETMFPLSVLCVSVSKGRVDVLHARRAMSRYRILSHRTFEHSDESFPSPDETAADAAIFMKDAGVMKSDAVLVIPRSWIIMKSVELPAAVKDSLAEVMNYEFDRFMPFGASEAAYDFFSEKRQDTIGIYIAVARAAVVNEYIEKLAAKSVSVRRVDFDVSALSGYCRFVSGLKTASFAGIAAVGYAGGVFEDEILKTASYNEFGADDDYRRAEEIENFLSAQKNAETAGAPTVPVMLSFADESSGVRSALASRANVTFRSVAEFGEKFKGGSPSSLDQNIAAGGAVGYLCPGAVGFNLLARGVRAEGKRSFLLSYILAGAILASLALWLFIPIMSERDRLEEIDRQISQRKTEVAAIEKIRDEITAIGKKAALMDGFKSGTTIRIELMKELTTVMPANAWLTRVRMIGDKINIEGYAQSATSLIQLLEASKHFKNVEFASPTFRDGQMNMDRFQIKMEMEISETPKEATSGEKQ
jgi:Tfp pilus assembly protein PilN